MKCSVCNLPIVEPRGNPKAPVLFLGEFPGVEEAHKGYAFVGRMAEALTQEMMYVGIPMQHLLFSNLWGHEPPRGKTGVIAAGSPCLDNFIRSAVSLMEGRQIVVLAGGEMAKAFLDDGIMSYSGLLVKPSLCPNIPYYIAMPNPAIMFRQKHGEIRLALKKLKFRMKELGL